MICSAYQWTSFYIIGRGGSRAAATSKIERFVIIVNGFQPLISITKHSILDVAAAIDPPLIGTSVMKEFSKFEPWQQPEYKLNCTCLLKDMRDNYNYLKRYVFIIIRLKMLGFFNESKECLFLDLLRTCGQLGPFFCSFFNSRIFVSRKSVYNNLKKVMTSTNVRRSHTASWLKQTLWAQVFPCYLCKLTWLGLTFIDTKT